MWKLWKQQIGWLTEWSIALVSLLKEARFWDLEPATSSESIHHFNCSGSSCSDKMRGGKFSRIDYFSFCFSLELSFLTTRPHSLYLIQCLWAMCLIFFYRLTVFWSTFCLTIPRFEPPSSGCTARTQTLGQNAAGCRCWYQRDGQSLCCTHSAASTPLHQMFYIYHLCVF